VFRFRGLAAHASIAEACAAVNAVSLLVSS
jgi:hypothetical protein